MGGDNQSDVVKKLKDTCMHPQPKPTQAEPTAADFIGSSSKPISPAYEKRQAQSKVLEQQRPAARPTHKTAHSFHNSRRFR